MWLQSGNQSGSGDGSQGAWGWQSGSQSGSRDGSHGASHVVWLQSGNQSGSGDGSQGASQVVRIAVREQVR